MRDERITVSRWRIYLGLIVAPLAAPLLLFSALHTIDAFTSRPLANYGIGSLTLAMITGAPMSYINAAVVVYLIRVFFGLDGLRNWWLLAGGGWAAGTLTMLLTASRLEGSLMFVALGGLAGAISAALFWAIAFYDRKARRAPRVVTSSNDRLA